MSEEESFEGFAWGEEAEFGGSSDLSVGWCGLDVFAQRIVAWHAATRKDVSLVETPLRMALWERQRSGHPVAPGQLIHHSDAGSQYTAIRFTEHLALEQITPSIGSVGDNFGPPPSFGPVAL